ncbi:MAG: hypothetical protein E7403_01585 [Ruminococcaceae bacterium]|nr:hypothetical protein [Oscillospiraceae bacterium]
MINISCDCKSDCTTLGILAALLVGVVTAILRFMATITVTPAFLWVALGIATVYLAVLLFHAGRYRTEGCRCCCKSLKTLLVGILGTALLSVVLLAIPFAATSVLGAIITGLLLTFLSLIFTSTACLVTCSADCTALED